jgi:hypothetical protein
VDFRSGGKYDITLHLYKTSKPERVRIRIGDEYSIMDISPETNSLLLEDWVIPIGQHKITIELVQDSKVTSPYQLEILKK